ncbi:MAG: hypothetical protein A3J63_05240 [Candidatus Moranbacteria bacterium RIFCSPHIGHO2_02_FULL_40_12b]|nr:MAG: hypothetical protein A3J63_05240 [Candidatus Moranbacteria bacterium RIFCSPHIGHO2_02_FULL_40_12b]
MNKDISEKEALKRMLLRILSRINSAISSDNILTIDDVFEDKNFKIFLDLVYDGMERKKSMSNVIIRTRVALRPLEKMEEKEAVKVLNLMINGIENVNRTLAERRIQQKLKRNQ